ncbi:MAG: glutamine-hydrolyzing carbamoyl-phosphate synthase small subunit [Candidatus Hydrothermarchaeaceae archaeon]
MKELNAVLVLEDGTIIEGTGFGASKEVFGEAVFNTSMCGYQEALTDPSYKGQILMFTYPLVGNYGVNEGDFESDGIKAEGFIVRENCISPSHRDAKETLHDFLLENGTPGITGLDTRAITIKIRKYGTMKAALKVSEEEIDGKDLLKRARKQKDITELDLVSQVTSKQPTRHPNKGKKVALLDCGMKLSILRNLLDRGCDVTVFPAKTPPDEILDSRPEGILVSNGPGDPTQAPYVISTLRDLLSEKPMFGICLGQQLLALAVGGKTYKLKFGHRGINQPVKDLKNGRVYITTQNHGFAVDGDSLGDKGFHVSKINLNDNTPEGMHHEELPIFSVQYHPEANPGPKDSEYLFDEFLEMI